MLKIWYQYDIRDALSCLVFISQGVEVMALEVGISFLLCLLYLPVSLKGRKSNTRTQCFSRVRDLCSLLLFVERRGLYKLAFVFSECLVLSERLAGCLSVSRQMCNVHCQKTGVEVLCCHLYASVCTHIPQTFIQRLVKNYDMKKQDVQQ